jgi:serine/threonine protein kinase
VLHGDLAARNVLLADDNIVKIADFGLSRQIYKSGIYEKKGQEALPVKWMAIESLIDRVFSSQSDVWSFGVTIWELFSLSKQPYPGKENLINLADNKSIYSRYIFFNIWTEVSGLEGLIQFLQNGKRMERPELMPTAIGNVMADCWKHNEEERTTFAQLEQIFHKAVDPIIRQRFAGEEVMTEQNNYVKMNKEIRLNNPEAKSEYETMTSTENRQVVSLSNSSTSSQCPNAPGRLYPQLSVTNYIDARTEIDTLPQPPLSFQKSLADNSTQHYLDVLPDPQV